ncbi:hypothetical protein [Lamprocystis purpurea]|jgi:hypothetical protein|uniref:hypothetical protein n=1 Tax=Lamprocystis purpurea TaxID=61598 RepID=UPI0003621434|nr:hypothetical protein [Lamprocystis purpurea]
MAFEQRDLSGSLFRNDKATTDKHPTHKGSARIDDAEFWVSAWVKTGKPGSDGQATRFFSLAFEPKANGQSATDRAAAVLGSTFGLDAAAVLALLAAGGHPGASSAPSEPYGGGQEPANAWDDDIPF